MAKRPATHANAVVPGGSGDNSEFGGLGNSGDADATTLTPSTRDSAGNPTVAQFAGIGPTAPPAVTDAAGRDAVTGHNPDPKNR